MEFKVREISPGVFFTYWSGFGEYFIGYSPYEVVEHLESRLRCDVDYFIERNELQIQKEIPITELLRALG